MTLRTSAAVAALSAIVIATAACGGPRCGVDAKCAPPKPPPPPDDRPPVVVALVVDQLAAWVAYERLLELPPDGGFARLRLEGTWVREMHYMHSATDTAPGHSSLFTGRAPFESGIFGNEVPGEGGHVVSILRDEDTREIGPNGPLEKRSSSLRRLRVPTVADDLRERSPRSRIFAFSLKDRGALFGGGRKPDASIFFDQGEDLFVTSSAFAKELPPWVRALVSKEELSKERESAWTLGADESWIRGHALAPDEAPGEGDLGALGTTFPHKIGNGSAYRASPLSEARLGLLAAAALRAAAPDAPFFLSVSFSANDIVGHTFGPDSWEAWAEIRALDATLARLFAELDHTFGKDRWSAILAADHGTVTMPEASPLPHGWCPPTPAKPDRFDRPCKTSRLLPREIAKEVDAALVLLLGSDGWVDGIADPYMFDSKKAAELPAADRVRLHEAEKKVLLSTHGDMLADVWTIEELRSRCSKTPDVWDESIPALVCRAFTPAPLLPGAETRALYMIPKHGSFFDPAVVVGKGTSHGSPYLYDRTVPLLVRSPGRMLAGRIVDRPVRFDAYRDLLRSLLGITAELPEDVLARHQKPASR